MEETGREIRGTTPPDLSPFSRAKTIVAIREKGEVMLRSTTIAMAILLLAANVAQAQWSDGAGRSADHRYRLDDGSGENSIGLTNGGSFAWLTRYTIQPNDTLITHIEVAFGTPTSINGLPVTAYLWSDPNNDGIPDDARVLSSASGVIQGANESVPILNPHFVTFDIPDVAFAAGQNFFVGVIVQHLPGQFPAAIDQTEPLPGAGVTAGTGL